MPSNNPNDGREAGHPCPECGSGRLRFRKNSVTKGYFLGCNEFPKCEWACNPPPKQELRRRTALRRRAYYEVCDEVKREELWEIDDEHSRAAFLREDEVEDDGSYSLWDVLWAGEI